MSTTTEQRRVPWPLAFYRSAVGKKWVMALTGIGIIFFVLAHMVGNWKIFLPDVAGVPDIDIYAEALRELLVPFLPAHVALWILRTGLIVAFLLHIHAAYALTLMNSRARPEPYQGPRTYVAANYASRTMRWSGVIFAAFLLFHLADLTWGIQPMAPETWARGEVYANFIATFSRAPVTAFYVIAMVVLGLHLYHGAWSMFQSLGINHPRFNAVRRSFAIGLAVLVTVGNAIMPLAVYFGFVE
ncbi:MAG TPA: succinate dehydrogenase cytochrome b subunit [Acidimicrobiia bacterium]|nr:succinate dehydrogenase/fumarate reductase cytochrome b subunit, b558 family [Acidimicrobiia bacterium]HYJ25244.1 succinate dehydrogenase cytochrome b subunit [Acidimicrobiia bacterium]